MQNVRNELEKVIGYLGDALELYNKTWDEIRSAE